VKLGRRVISLRNWQGNGLQWIAPVRPRKPPELKETQQKCTWLPVENARETGAN